MDNLAMLTREDLPKQVREPAPDCRSDEAHQPHSRDKDLEVGWRMEGIPLMDRKARSIFLSSSG